MNNILRFATASLLTLGLGACADAVLVQDSPGPRHAYFDGDFEYATRDGAVVTEVAGNPFAMPKDRFDAAVRRLMYGQTEGLPVSFVERPASGKTDPAYKVVVAFNALPWVSGFELCEKGSLTPTRTGGGELNMAIAFCIGDSLKSDTSGFTSAVAGPDTPRFARLVRQVTLALIPTQDGEEAGEGDVVP